MGAALGIACLPWVLGSPAPADPPAGKAALRKRLNLAEFVKDPGRLASLRKGVQKMRALPPTDPRSWVFQANIHWRPFFPLHVHEQARTSKDPAQQLFRDDPGFTPDPNVFNQCPHGNWWFLPWHRAYLHYFERTLRWAAEDPDLTLPYWNYSDPEQRELPRVFRERTVDGRPNSLYLPESATFKDGKGDPQVFLMRDGPLLRGETQLSASVTRLNALSVLPFTNGKPAPANLAFASPLACDPTCLCGFGALEAIPHNRIHTAIGGSSAQSGGSVRIGFMGDTSTAARDPVFWVHHANIDRLWASWLALGQGRKNPEDPEWLQQTFTFFDVDPDGTPRPVTVAVQDLISTKALGYIYDHLEPLPKVVVAAVPGPRRAPDGPSIRALAATPAPPAPDLRPHKPKKSPPGITLTTTRSKVVTVPPAEGVKPARLQEAIAPAPGGGEGALLLSLEGITFDQLPGVDYQVYLNLPEKAEATPDSPYHVGTLTFFGHGHPPGAHGQRGARAPLYVKFAVPEALRKRLAEGKVGPRDLRVTFVPETGTVPVRAGVQVPAPPERVGVTIRQVRLLQVR
jgi:tyrosinase